MPAMRVWALGFEKRFHSHVNNLLSNDETVDPPARSVCVDVILYSLVSSLNKNQRPQIDRIVDYSL